MKDNKKVIILFIIVIFIFILIIIYNVYNNRERDIDRKVHKILDKYTYNEIVEAGYKLFLNSIKIININNLEYETNNTNGYIYYYFDDIKYKRIEDFLIISNTLNKKDLERYMNDKKIINIDNNYYIEDYWDNENKEYVGSIIELDYYDYYNVFFNSENYYCDNYEYIGILDSEPDCNYYITRTRFSISVEDDMLKINNLDDIKKIY